MKEELRNKAVLAMYDVRGIQDYVFKTNAAREVIGASEIVEDIITSGLNEYVDENVDDSNKSKYLIDWKEKVEKKWMPSNENSEDAFIKEDSDILMQVMFIGGGNAYVLYRTGELCSEVNRFLGKYVLKETYSLNLAVAVVEKTNSYKKDYDAINDEMRRIKARMPQSQPIGALPFMAIDTITGFPITAKDELKKKAICTESKLKIEKFKKCKEKEDTEKVFDNIVTEKGDNSTLAIIHIDGNSLGKRIMNEMSGVTEYQKAIYKMRNLSLEINNTFENAFREMTKKLDEISKTEFKDVNKKYRKIVVAGDDITYICNAKLAIPSVEKFIEVLNETRGDVFDVFSACAGIAFFNSHFPFSDAYKVAEACCESAKEKAKSDECAGTKDENVGNFFDFQMCTNVNASDLDSYREKHYTVDGDSFVQRPYYIKVVRDNGLNGKKENQNHSYELLVEKIKLLVKLPRSLAKEIRSVIPQGDNEIDKEVSFLESRGYNEIAKDLKANKKIYYDACELMDFYLEEEDSKHDENKN